MCREEAEYDLLLFVAVFGLHGNPDVFLTEDLRSRVVEAGKSGDRSNAVHHRAGYMFVPLTHSQTKHPSKPKSRLIRKH
ncbi:hypothetical protein K503DRAFT_91757 [Rhizopogon vinicolor AM-OR11-026]|uniref:Uncharacterized protein n=1 Tax=Rhizopogon vinicolor AM-OR11-026 TaxID=1314800 RepID=A0A1B7MFL8_9AGAM|nr:hypothetical protein K503DRAFT_91757 [Rhizopogon vinicolor AM-OR11-026]